MFKGNSNDYRNNIQVILTVNVEHLQQKSCVFTVTLDTKKPDGPAITYFLEFSRNDASNLWRKIRERI